MATETELQLTQENPGWLSVCDWIQWKPTSMAQLAQAEAKMLAHLKSSLRSKYVSIAGGAKRLWTILLNQEVNRLPLVMVHGMGGGVGLWALNLDELAQNRPVYAFDLLGFGRSSRPQFASDATLVESEFVDSIEDWRKAMGLNKFILLGHSLGGFISASYALRYPQHVNHLILVDPWGFAEKQETHRTVTLPMWIRIVANMLKPFNPLAGLRAAGPWGPSLVRRFRPDFKHKFSNLFKDEADEAVFDYIYHCNAQTPSGEAGFRSMTIPFGWAKQPMITRMDAIDKDLPISLIYGSRSWIDNTPAWQIKHQRKESYTNIQIIEGAGHHVYADQAPEFNRIVRKICDNSDITNDVHVRDEESGEDTHM